MNDELNDLYVSSDEIQKLILNNPFIKRMGNDVTEKSLLKWVTKESMSKFEKRAKKRDVLGSITKFLFDGIFVQKEKGRTTILKPTKKYFVLKDGGLIEDSPINSNFSISHNINETEDQFFSACDVESEALAISNFECTNMEFHDILVSKMNNDNGRHKEITKYSPLFFDLLCNILNYKFTDWHTKILISSALGYFVLDDDIIPDHDEDGYVDDLFIVCYVLKEIKNNISSTLIEDNWYYDGDVLQLIDEIYNQSYDVVEDNVCAILQKVGLHKFKTLELEEYSGEYPHKISKLGHEKRELLALLAFLIKQMYHVNMNNKKTETIKKFLQQYGDYQEINRLIELSMTNHEIQMINDENVDDFESELEEELRQARLDALSM